ncbi:MAG: Imm70 family immunity protein [Terricaulis sp.]
MVLVIYENDEDIDEVAVGSYSDFGALRDYIVRELEHGRPGSRFPTFIRHSDCDGEWTVDECDDLRSELWLIAAEMQARPAIPFPSQWQAQVSHDRGLRPDSAYQCFVDPNAQPVIGEIARLVDLALKKGLPISFQ